VSAGPISGMGRDGMGQKWDRIAFFERNGPKSKTELGYFERNGTGMVIFERDWLFLGPNMPN